MNGIKVRTPTIPGEAANPEVRNNSPIFGGELCFKTILPSNQAQNVMNSHKKRPMAIPTSKAGSDMTPAILKNPANPIPMLRLSIASK